MGVTVLTASLPERAVLLGEACQSVRDQIIAPDAYLIGVDTHRNGGPAVYNQLARAVDTDHLVLLDDDDLLHPDHLLTLLQHQTDADIVYTPAKVEQRPGAPEFTNYDQPFNLDLLRRQCIVAPTALIPTGLWHEIGGLTDGPGYDWRFWLAAVNAGATFLRIDRETWNYRLNTGFGNHSWGEL